jgi:hypothetical protein
LPILLLLECRLNAFDKFDADRASRRHNCIPAWLQFRAAVDDCLASYGRMDEGREYPAEIVQNEEKSLITVNCRRQSTSGNGMVSVTAKMTVADKKTAMPAETDIAVVQKRGVA